MPCIGARFCNTLFRGARNVGFQLTATWLQNLLVVKSMEYPPVDRKRISPTRGLQQKPDLEARRYCSNDSVPAGGHRLRYT